jgi:hypothetical protein
MGTDPQILQHREWLGLLQPVGLVVSPLALTRAQVVVDRAIPIELQPKLHELLAEAKLAAPEVSADDTLTPLDFATFTQQILGWEAEDLVPQTELPESLSLDLREYGETLRPTFGVKNPDSQEWIMLVQVVTNKQDLDEHPGQGGWQATVQERFERLLRAAEVPAGILWNGVALRLVYAPRGESSGHLTFPLAAMTEVAGRLILGAMAGLLNDQRMFNVPIDRRLPKILENSREYQSEVSEKLAEQVVDALWELLRGFQMADAAVQGKLIAKIQEDSEDWQQHVYGGLITTLMRLVFMLYAEDEGIMPNDPVYQQYYAVSGLYEQLRSDNSSYPDTMDERYGAWVGLLSLFRLIYEGGGATPEYLPARYGQLFDPLEFLFLEGHGVPPQIPDGVIYRVLDKLLMLDGERLSYRSLDVEQIGSVYEGIMGYTVNRAATLSIGVNSKPKGSKHSTTVVVDVEGLLAAKPGDRAKLLKDWANCELTATTAKAVKEAQTAEGLVAAIGQRVSKRTRDLLPVGSLFLQPTEERRRSGSHYTPRKLTQPIVENTLRPVLANLGAAPTAAQILDLKVCDLAMGSGAFLVEVCRQLAEEVLAAWNRGGEMVFTGERGRAGQAPEETSGDTLLALEEEPLLMARRLVAQQCLYGVDKNPFAVNLAKLSLWLVTLSRDLPFTFLDHALKCGDSLVGRSRREINAFGRIESDLAGSPLGDVLDKQVLAAKLFRSEIQVQDTRSDAQALAKAEKWRSAEEALAGVRLRGDVSIAAFFDGVGMKAQEKKDLVREYGGMVHLQPERMVEVSVSLRERVMPFNWEIEFPEVFDRENPGFDSIVGNPPFAGKNTTTSGNAEGYGDWLKDVYAESHGNSDLVAFFFRRSFELLREQGTFGLISTNTIAQGDTRSTGLRFICNNGGLIYNATRRYKWPGLAAVVVSLVHVIKIKEAVKS